MEAFNCTLFVLTRGRFLNSLRDGGGPLDFLEVAIRVLRREVYCAVGECFAFCDVVGQGFLGNRVEERGERPSA